MLEHIKLDLVRLMLLHALCATLAPIKQDPELPPRCNAHSVTQVPFKQGPG